MTAVARLFAWLTLALAMVACASPAPTPTALPSTLSPATTPTPVVEVTLDPATNWRLVAQLELPCCDKGFERWPYSVRAAVSDTEWSALWSSMSPAQEAPPVDFDNEVVLAFGEGHGSSCPKVRLDGLVIDAAGRLIYSQMSDPEGHQACTADLSGAAIFVVAIRKEALPASPFAVRLHRMRTCPSCDDEITINQP